MSQAAALLNSLAEPAAYSTNSDAVIAIGDDRFITVPDSLKRIAVQFDHNIETVSFDCPRFWDGNDMSQMKIYVNYMLPNGKTGQYLAQNVSASGQRMTFDWTISGNVTKYKGKLAFLICIKRTDGDGNEERHWNSELNRDLYISEGLECTQETLARYPDTITQLLLRMDEVEAMATPEAMQAYTNTWLEENRNSLLSEKANVIALESEGASISVDDSADAYLLGLKLYGKTTQAADPTPDNPQELASVENPFVTFSHANLISPIDTIAGDISVPSERIYCGPGQTLVVTVTKARVDGVEITNNRIYPCVLLETDESGAEAPTYPDSVSLPSGSATYTVTFVTKASTKSVRVNFTNNNSDSNLNTHVSNTSVMLFGVDCTENDYAPAQSLSISHTLPGIPVTTGGNYTDVNGQQWICDEIDFERGVYVQRVKEQVITRTPYFAETADLPGRFNWFCLDGEFKNGRASAFLNFAKWTAWGSPTKDVDCGGVSINQVYYSPAVAMTVDEVNAKFAEMIASDTPPTIIGQLETPIETPLTDEEITNFKMLCTYYHNTTFLNDAGAHMTVKYAADTKIYVDSHSIAQLTSPDGTVWNLTVANDGTISAVKQ